MLLRGYSLSAVLCLHDSYYRNHTFLEEYFRDRGIGYWTIKPPPEKYGTVEEDGVRLEQWYKEIEKSFECEQGGGVGDAARWLEEKHKRRIEELGGMPQRTLDSIWWPFTQHQLVSTLHISHATRALRTVDRQEGRCHGRGLGFRR